MFSSVTHTVYTTQNSLTRTLTWNSPSNSIFCVFRSWCKRGGFMLWRKLTPRAISYRILSRKGQASTGYMSFCRQSDKNRVRIKWGERNYSKLVQAWNSPIYQLPSLFSFLPCLPKSFIRDSKNLQVSLLLTISQARMRKPTQWERCIKKIPDTCLERQKTPFHFNHSEVNKQDLEC